MTAVGSTDRPEFGNYISMKNAVRSKKLFARATQVIPGGVDSPVRAFQAVGGSPLFIKSAAGAIIQDVDGNRFID